MKQHIQLFENFSNSTFSSDEVQNETDDVYLWRDTLKKIDWFSQDLNDYIGGAFDTEEEWDKVTKILLKLKGAVKELKDLTKK